MDLNRKCQHTELLSGPLFKRGEILAPIFDNTCICGKIYSICVFHTGQYPNNLIKPIQGVPRDDFMLSDNDVAFLFNIYP